MVIYNSPLKKAANVSEISTASLIRVISIAIDIVINVSIREAEQNKK